jgi:hypothetical protein
MNYGWLKALGCLLVVASIGLPIITLIDFAVLGAACLCLLFAPTNRSTFARLAPRPDAKPEAQLGPEPQPQPQSQSQSQLAPQLAPGHTPAPTLNIGRRLGAAILVTVITIAISLWLPRAAIEEGQGVFFPNAGDTTYQSALAPEVFEHLRREFDATFPLEAQCDGVAKPCWLKFNVTPPPGGFGFSSESLVRPAKHSRVVDTIDFDSRETLPLAALNDLRYNFHPPHSHTWVRREIPYFVQYTLPAHLQGSKMCWRGDVFWEQPAGTFERITHTSSQCVELTGELLGRNIIGVEVLPNAPLQMRLELGTTLSRAHTARWGISYLAVVLIVLALCDLRAWQRLVLPLGALAATIVWAIIVEPTSYTGFRLHWGGGDGLGYESFARDMVRAAANGDWAQAAMGVEPIFWSMPGLRYYLALLKPVFADTFFAYLAACVFLPIVVYRILLVLTSPRASAILTSAFLLTPVFEFFRFTHYIYVKLIVDKGFAETLGYLLFLCAIMLAIKPFAPGSATGSAMGSAMGRASISFARRTAVLIGFTCFAAVAMRPNLAPSVGLLLVVVGLYQLRAGSVRGFVALCLGFAPIALLSIHNYAYGGEFHLLTMTGDHPANLEMPPSVYLRAISQLFSWDLQGAAFQRMAKQLYTWNSPDEFYRVIAFFVVCWVACGRRQPRAMRLVAWLALSQQATLFFFHASGRYAFMAWLLTFMVFVSVLVNRTWPWWTKRYQKRRQALDSVPSSASASGK